MESTRRRLSAQRKTPSRAAPRRPRRAEVEITPRAHLLLFLRLDLAAQIDAGHGLRDADDLLEVVSSACHATSRAFSYEIRPLRIACRSSGSTRSLRSSAMRCPTVRSDILSRSEQ